MKNASMKLLIRYNFREILTLCLLGMSANNLCQQFLDTDLHEFSYFLLNPICKFILYISFFKCTKYTNKMCLNQTVLDPDQTRQIVGILFQTV